MIHGWRRSAIGATVTLMLTSRRDNSNFSVYPPTTSTFAMTELAFAKKRKHHENEQTDGGSSHKKARKDKKQNKKREKGRAMEGNANSAFRVVSASVVLSIPPVFAMEPMKGVNELLDSLVMRCVESSVKISSSYLVETSASDTYPH